jgi:nicotinamidase-related amidase
VSIEERTRNTKFLRQNHMDFEIVGKPALVLIHLQNNLVGGIGPAMPDWMPSALQGIRDSGMIGKCKMLADTFRAKGLPVIFVHADGDPIGKVPAYGDLWRQIEKSGHNFTDEEKKRYWGVVPEMEYNPKTDDLICNWFSSPFNMSGLELVFKKYNVDTAVFGGFALMSAVYTACNACSDKLYNSIMAVDASYVSVPPVTPGYHEGLNDVVAEAVIRVMAPAIAQVTDAATVIDKVNKLKLY